MSQFDMSSGETSDKHAHLGGDEQINKLTMHILLNVKNRCTSSVVIREIADITRAKAAANKYKTNVFKHSIVLSVAREVHTFVEGPCSDGIVSPSLSSMTMCSSGWSVAQEKPRLH